jgi:hypothetical protein
MSAAAEKIKALQEGKLASLLEKYRQVLDPRDPEVRRRVAEQIAALDPDVEEDAMRWIESVQDFDNEDAEKESR